MVVLDSETAWLIAGGVGLVIGIAALGINLSIRQTRKSTRQESQALQEEVRRLQGTQSRASNVTNEIASSIRRAALAEALASHPELADTADPESIKRLNVLVDEIYQRMELQHEVAALQASQEEERRAEEARQERQRKIEEGKERARDQQRAKEESIRQAELRRQQQIAAMPPLRRWAVTHKPAAIGIGAVCVIALISATGLAVTSVQRSLQEQAAAEASAAAAEASAAAAAAKAEQEARAEREAQAEADRIAQLEAACDLAIPEREIPPEVWSAWLDCEDKEVVAQAILRAPRDAIDPSLLKEVAETSRDDEVAAFISASPRTPASAHKVLVAAWGPETVSRSYAVVYDQVCATGVLPEEYVGRTTWRDEDGNVIEFTTNRCSIRGISGSKYLSSSSRQSWSQASGSVSIGPVTYVKDGDTLVIGKDSAWFGSTLVPQRWAKAS